MFKNFSEHMWYLLSAPFKKEKKSKNQFWIFCEVFGNVCDKCIDALRLALTQSSIKTCKEILLPEYGKDRQMPMLDGEESEAYRKRLLAKPDIASMAGTQKGILYALTLLGYGKSYIESAYILYPDRWADFIIYLEGNNPTITNIDIIDSEVMKIKRARSMPIYMIESSNDIIISGAEVTFYNDYPRCGELICGTYPPDSEEV